VLLPCRITPSGVCCRLSYPHSNERTQHSTPEPHGDQCWSKRVQDRQRMCMRTNRRASSVLRAPTRLNSARIPASSPFGCERRPLVFTLSTEAHEPSADLPTALAARGLAGERLLLCSLSPVSSPHIFIRGSSCSFSICVCLGSSLVTTWPVGIKNFTNLAWGWRLRIVC
jgi:hypothetical protein